MKLQYHLLPAATALAVVGMLAACSGKPGDAAQINVPGNPAIVETINGTRVPELLLAKLAKGRQLDLSKPEDHEAALKELTDYVLLAQQADRAGYLRDADFATDIELARLQALANRTIIAMRQSAKIDDSLLKAEYDQQVARLGDKQYDISQLIFRTEDEAMKAAGDLLAGRSWREVFDTLGPQAQQAKVFSGVKLAQLPEPLAAAVRETPTGQAMKVPVQTQYGWHLIHVDLVAPFNPGSFDELKEGIRATLAGQLANDELQKLRDSAKVELLIAAPVAAAASDPAAPAGSKSD